MGVYFGFAEAFGFTPDQVDELDNYTIEAFSIIATARKREMERKMRANTRR